MYRGIGAVIKVPNICIYFGPRGTLPHEHVYILGFTKMRQSLLVEAVSKLSIGAVFS